MSRPYVALVSLDSILAKINQCMMGLAAATIFVMACAVTADVVGRNLSLFALPWTSELSEYGLYLASVLIAPWLLRRGQHVSVGILVDALPHAASRIVRMAGNSLCALVSGALGWYAVQATLRSYADQSLVIKNIVFPEWWTLVPISIVFFVLMVEFLILIFLDRRQPETIPL